MKSNPQQKKTFGDLYGDLIDGKYIHFDNKLQAPLQYLQGLHERLYNNEPEKKKSFELTDKDLNVGVNAVYSLMEGKDIHSVPTYKGSVVLPEITITPEESYIEDPIIGARLKRRLCYGGRLGF